MVKIKKVKIDDLKKKVEELENKWKRALADYDNLRKRIEREKGDFVKFSNASLIDKLLPVLDSLEKCTEHLGDKGLELTLEQFRKVLESEGLKEIRAEGRRFDPELMDAVEMVKGPKDKTMEVVLKGYFLNDKVLRPARVKVGLKKVERKKVKLAKEGHKAGDYL